MNFVELMVSLWCHKLQPLDLTVYGPLKKAYAHQCDLFLRNNNQKITPYDVAAIFKDAYFRIATIQKAQNGFLVSGVVPYNSNVFTEEDFLPATLVMEPTTDENNLLEVTNQIQSDNQSSNIECKIIEAGPSQTTGPSTINVSVAEISLLNVKKLKTKRNYKKGSSKILTATPEKNDLIQKEQRKILKRKLNYTGLKEDAIIKKKKKLGKKL